MKYTPNYGLKKPEQDDFYNVDDFNENADIIDQKLKENADAIVAHQNKMESLIKIKKDVVILASGWVDDTANSGFWIYDIEDEDITEDTVVDVNIHLQDLEKAESIKIKSANSSSAGKVILYAEDKPTDNIICDLKLVRQVNE